jgi:SAM-dependent methyltransferase
MLYGDDLARIQDEGFADFSAAIAPGLIDLLAPLPRGTRVVDVGCGAGLTTRALTDAGFHVTAIEPSRPLLERARGRAPAATFVNGSVWDVEVPRASAIVAVGEPLTYHPVGTDGRARLVALFGAAAAALEPGGLLVFDLIVTGPSLAARAWRSAPGWALLVEVHEPASERLVREIVTFVEEPSGLFRRATERHEVQRFDEGAVREALERAGFEVVVQERLGAAPMLPSRRLFIATRR